MKNLNNVEMTLNANNKEEMEMKNTLNELINKGIAMDCIIEYGEELSRSYATVWFLDSEPIISEPYGDYESGRWYYNRETEFSILSVE